jgi:hypothetical protein
MTSLVVEHFDAPGSIRDSRAFGAAGDRAGDVLAGRTVWCAAALPAGDAPAQELRTRIEGAGPEVAAASLEVPEPGDQLRQLAERIDEMLTGFAPPQDLVRSEWEIYAEAARVVEDLVGDWLRPDDVMVAHDAYSALLSPAVRARGAHAVWRFRIGFPSEASPRGGLEFIRRFTAGIDAYLLSWIERTARGEAVERVAAAMPSAGIVAAKEFPTRDARDEPRRLAWRMAVAEVVRTDRGEAVGGTLHARPTIAVH